MTSVLIVVTGSDHWTLNDGTLHPTGFWAEELLSPLSVFKDAGIPFTIATPGGVRPTVDETSLAPESTGGADESARQRAALDALDDQLAAPLKLEDVSADDYAAVYIPGGHGPMEDLAVSPVLGKLLITMLDAGKVIGSVCHGPAALLSATKPDGEWAFAGRVMSGFTNDEERQAGLADKAPWLLEDRLRAAGADLKVGPAWGPFSVVDGTVVTGQNPQSSTEVAEKIVAQLQK
ncbi:type 1 glutamine amidotransferase domain-containing protein [Rhodococcus sp. PAMC28707]|uniref:type 1 glutamine amidotransferase domain-containing protein n=1 Tax=unclassified Rhodococcus (in: high G+C Gram-positive bacteria) TaxID=192944 RepID=UPI00109DA52B|nr:MULTISPECIES: type 1 glutamine amidotransferase domain-containing protein [unclassified Rhodococcus (in: high G+C Gram-positive bacteria)]QCB49860.1 type 1 glutamine amidotransferase domain-containing protein [Rhodococcus sp. PAMC28705]QCB58447.1 type 1 glutamine amidotransferase domain-containing protein [Rhodococcus sp. PAMC28707]